MAISKIDALARRLTARVASLERKNALCIETLEHIYRYWNYYPRDPHAKTAMLQLITDTINANASRPRIK